MTKPIALIQGSHQNCGIYHFGNNIVNLVGDLPIVLVPVSAMPDLTNLSANFSGVVLNYHSATMSWVSHAAIRAFKGAGLRVGLIPHDAQAANLSSPDVDLLILDDPTKVDTGSVVYLTRPPMPQAESFDVWPNTIGFFGFIFPHKRIESICDWVYRDFPGEAWNIRLIAPPYDHHNGVYIESLIANLQSRYANIQIDWDHRNLRNDQIVSKLAQNTINVYPFVSETDNEVGISSSLDFALAARRPFGITKHRLFRHIWQEEPSVLLPDNSLQSIINAGIAPLQKFYHRWTEEAYRNKWRKIISLLST